MSSPEFKNRGMYFEEFKEGAVIRTAGRTITEADVVNFAGLSGDYNLIHTDTVYAESTQFGQRIAHGLLGLSIATGLAVQTGILEGTIIAFREVEGIKFSTPIFIGDTIHAEMTVQGVKAFPRLGGGQVDIALVVKKQDDSIAMKGILKFLMQGKPGE